MADEGKGELTAIRPSLLAQLMVRLSNDGRNV